MAFPQTRLTLIQRLAAGGSQAEWQAFVADYWGPVFHFCLRRGGLQQDLAEDITAEVFVVLWHKNLLKRWDANPSAKLRTLICSVARKLLSQYLRKHQPQSLPAEELGDEAADVDCFYAAWAEDILRRSFDTLAMHYRRKGQGDYLRVFHGRVCEGLSIHEVAQALAMPESAVDHHYRHVRDRLQMELTRLVREQIAQYTEENGDTEFNLEWQQLGEYLRQHGDIEQVLGKAYAQIDSATVSVCRDRGIAKTVIRLSTLLPPQENSSNAKP